ncbi:MAG: hypothetical protein ACYSWQ_17200 [Planctomycetota bacterium]|jgi:uncharacterized repeat protein (TIGR01451 family)
MKERNRKSVSRAGALLTLLAVVTLMTTGTQTATAKSLYVIADVTATDGTQPLHAYDIGADGKLTFQAEHRIRHRMLGGVGLAIDSDFGYLFVTYEADERIQVVDGTTMTDAGVVTAEGADDLAGVVYDHSKSLLYCVDRRKDNLYVYDWDPHAIKLTNVTGSPFTLRRASAWGIALDEIDGLLYVGNGSTTVTVYSTDDWSLVESIELEHVAISVAVDVMNGFLYTGGAWAENFHLTQYHLAKGVEHSVQVEPDGGVMGLGVDPDTGLVYVGTGKNNAPGGDNLLTYDTDLNQIDKLHIGGNSTGLVIPGKDIGFNPLNLTKELVSGAAGDTGPGEMPSVGTGRTITYAVGFGNRSNEFTVTDVSIVDMLPREVTFVSAEDDGVGGHYDSKTHSFIWNYADLPPGTTSMLELTVMVERDVEAGTIISNSVTINSNETPPTTTRFDVMAINNSLNLEKTIKGATEGLVATVEPNEIVTYTIRFDNQDNDFTATDVLLVDTLPSDVDFISADTGKINGNYDPKSHTFTWGPRDLAPGSSASFDIVVRVHPGLPAGTVIRNSAVIDSEETPASVVNVDAIITFNSLGISKAVVGDAGEKPKLVGEGENIEYVICFENRNADAVTDVTVVDTLPEEVSFVKARSEGAAGRYDSKTHTYTWSFPSLEPNAKSPTCVELTVRVNKGVAPATVITNSVAISSHETPSTTVINSDAVTYFNPLELKKVVVGGFGGDIEWVDIDDDVTYGIEYTNSNEFAVTDVIITDKLPKEVSFVSADYDGVFGSYDPNSHTYQWVFPSLHAGESAMVELVVHINPNVKPFTTITNLVNIDSDQTVEAPSGTTIDVVTAEPPIPVRSLTIIPDIIRNMSGSGDIQAVLILPDGVERDRISEVVLPMLKPGNVKAKRHVIFGTDTRSKVIAIFDRDEIVEAVGEYGPAKLKVKGKFKTGRSFIGEAIVHITRFTGN